MVIGESKQSGAGCSGHSADTLEGSRRIPLLSSMTTRQSWATVSLRAPTVVRHDGKYKMWYIGTHHRSRDPRCSLGYAESDEGLEWREFPGNPIATPEDLPFGSGWSTPCVLFDSQEGCFKMWFTAVDMDCVGESTARGIRQRLAYATSPDGLRWTVYPEPLYPSARSPCVLKGTDGYRLWAGSSPRGDDDFNALVSNIYRFTSSDGIHWTRDKEPAITVSGRVKSVVYPWVTQHGNFWSMLYGSHVANGFFELHHAVSVDGLRWTPDHQDSVFPATRRPGDFDGRYTSMPCLLVETDRVLLYYASRDTGCLYGGSDGRLHADASGIYRHIGLAIAKGPLKDCT